MEKTYDALIIPTGETTSGDRSFPVTNRAIELFKSGKYGCIFITGGHGGFARATPGKTISEADETLGYIFDRGMYGERVYSDGRSLETVGNFTFPLVDPLIYNPGMDAFRKMLIIGQEGHVWRMRDYTKLVFDDKKNKVHFHLVPGKHNNGIMAKVYHAGIMNALADKKGAEEIHDFLMNEHPFYSKGWYEKSPSIRKLEMALTGLSWLRK
jgi:hypothetical protein